MRDSVGNSETRIPERCSGSINGYTSQDHTPAKIRLIVCAAIRHRTSGVMFCGVRHGDCLNNAFQYGLSNQSSGEIWEFGFVDQHGDFLTRSEAWKVADAAGQIRRPKGYEQDYKNQRKSNIGDEGSLFSENLY